VYTIVLNYNRDTLDHYSGLQAAATTVNAAFSKSQHSAITVADINKNPTESSTATDYAELLACTNGDGTLTDYAELLARTNGDVHS
jgi:hypothetical protein